MLAPREEISALIFPEQLTFLGSYTFFMASVTGPMLIDFYVIRRGNIHVPSYYNRAKESIYCFGSPVRNNWRGCVAFVSGIVSVKLHCTCGGLNALALGGAGRAPRSTPSLS